MKIDVRSQLPYLRENFSALNSRAQPLWHPLGFVSCIIRDEEKYTTRVHYWPKNERRHKNPNWPIHTHAYVLDSLVLEGRVRDIQYRQGEGSEYTIYSVSYSDQNSTIDRTDQHISIEYLVDDVRESGEEYSVPIGTFHQTLVPTNESAITLVVISRFGSVNPLVLGAAENESYPYDRVEYDKLVFWNRVRRAIKIFRTD
jgi:hypothetical protein